MILKHSLPERITFGALLAMVLVLGLLHAVSAARDSARVRQAIRGEVAGHEVVGWGRVIDTAMRVVLPPPTCPSDRSGSMTLRSAVTFTLLGHDGRDGDTATIYHFASNSLPAPGTRIAVFGDYFSAGGWRLFGRWLDPRDESPFFRVPADLPDALSGVKAGKRTVSAHVVSEEIEQRSMLLHRSALGTAQRGAVVRVLNVTYTTNRSADCHVAVLNWIGPPGQFLGDVVFSDAMQCTFEVAVGDTLVLPIAAADESSVTLPGCPGLYQVRCGVVVASRKTLADVESASDIAASGLWHRYREGY